MFLYVFSLTLSREQRRLKLEMVSLPLLSKRGVLEPTKMESSCWSTECWTGFLFLFLNCFNFSTAADSYEHVPPANKL